MSDVRMSDRNTLSSLPPSPRGASPPPSIDCPTMAPKCPTAAVVMAALLFSSAGVARRSAAFIVGRRRPLALCSSAATSSLPSDGDHHRQQIPDDWKGASEKKSDFITHFVAGRQPNLTVEAAVESLIKSPSNADDASANWSLRRDAIVQRENDALIREADSALRHNTSAFPMPVSGGESLCAAELLALGSIWFLPADAPRDAALGGKPIRLNATDVDKILEEGDYLRVHNPPRRFPAVNEYDWGAKSGENNDRGVVVAKDDEIGYLIVDKPAGLPVHGTVDNALENVAAAVGRSLLESRENKLREAIANRIKLGHDEEFFDMSNSTDRKKKRKKDKQKKEPLVYISNPQRLDQNTSGLFVLSTKKVFASYFAKLLRMKTDVQLADDTRTDCAVHKTYRCLVCACPGQADVSNGGKTNSATDELARLRRYAEERSTVRHWLEPSIRAPKTFAAVQGDSSWAECILKVKQVGDAFPVVGSEAANKLSRALWEEEGSKPRECVAVVEVEIELLTGRTHQIRGQMSAEGFPLVGDIGYGGALPTPPTPVGSSGGVTKSIKVPEKLALQCCQLEFIEPKYHLKKKKDEMVGVPSDKWRSFRLDRAFWTPMLEDYSTCTANANVAEATFSRSDEEDARQLRAMVPDGSADAGDKTNVAGPPLPQRVRLSPGKNKYVIIEAKSRSKETLQFVRSASPSECGGPYHADVARDVIRELTLLGYSCSVMGGGRIDYVAPHAHVFGFSYGFGKGDHEAVAQIIEGQSDDEIYATFDNADGLY